MMHSYADYNALHFFKTLITVIPFANILQWMISKHFFKVISYAVYLANHVTIRKKNTCAHYYTAINVISQGAFINK